MTEPKHIIQKLFVEVNTSDVKEANNIKNNIDLFLKNEVLPELERLLDKYGTTELISRIASLDIDFGVSVSKDKSFWKTEIVEQFEKQLLHQLKSAKQFKIEKKSSNSVLLSESGNNQEVFFFFLENGYLPWYGRETQIVKFEQDVLVKTVQLDDVFFDRLIQIFTQNPKSVERFVNQFSPKLAVIFLVGLNQGLKDRKTEILSSLKNNNGLFAAKWLQILFIVSTYQPVELIVDTIESWFQFLHKSVSGWPQKDKKEASLFFKLFLTATRESTLSNKKFQNILNQSLSIVAMEKTLPELFGKISKQKKKSEEYFFNKKQDEIAVQNAGVILLHPFLKSFYSELNIIDKTGKLKQSKKELATQILHFMATGEENVFEANLVFEKFLCGLPLEMPVQRESLISPKIKNEVNNLLEDAIKHWQVLKNTSPDGLREAFLQRDGKLIQNERNFNLVVERKALDVLLDKLPWNLSMVKIPWMDRLVYVDW
ncbi:contractile injection system tape measure protein [Maribellus maritimus]|uniref:contractile injection system tape measure protein n=1 Tax=Maribellus maritimus TaxID=2870838 RepID=UPI001EEBA7B9|nr:contractile injection system tape measure protein [Maribellus maritimus]MCG6187827.1 hypothetical protein [Maribellus maritimus]